MLRVKNNYRLCNVVLTSFKSSLKGIGISIAARHMTGDKKYIYNLKVVGSGQVTFGDGAA